VGGRREGETRERMREIEKGGRGGRGEREKDRESSTEGKRRESRGREGE